MLYILTDVFEFHEFCFLTDVFECQQNPCLNGASCVETFGAYFCVCPPGLTGPLCEDGRGLLHLIWFTERRKRIKFLSYFAKFRKLKFVLL